MERKAANNRNNANLHKLQDTLKNYRQNTGLEKLPPFAAFVSPSQVNGVINFRYTLDRSFNIESTGADQLEGQNDTQPNTAEQLSGKHLARDQNRDMLPSSLKVPVYWSIFTAEKVILKSYQPSGKLPRASECYFKGDSRVPVYVRLFYDSVLDMGWNRSFLFIADQLPYKFEVNISPEFKLKKNKVPILKRIADLMLFDKESKDKAKAILKSAGAYSFKYTLGKIEEIEGGTVRNYSFCLACGNWVEKHEQVCKRDEGNYCIDNINNWLKRRLGVKTKDLKQKKNELYDQLQKDIETYHYAGHEKFKERHPELYEPQKRGPKPKNVS